MPRQPTRVLPAAVLFDLDGTLLDSEPLWIEAETRIVAEYGGTWTIEQAETLIGLALIQAARQLAERGPVPLAPELIVEWMQRQVAEQVRSAPPWKAGARELLADVRAAGVPTALVTMSFAAGADAALAGLPEGSFDAVVSGDQVRRGKPDPEAYLLAARRLGVDARDCVAIEDSPTGARSASAAGCAVLTVPAGPSWELPPDLSDAARTTSLVGWDVAALGALLADRVDA